MMKISLFALMLISATSAVSSENIYTTLGMLKTKDYLIEMGIQNSVQVFKIKTHEGEGVTNLITEKELLASFPKLYDMVKNSIADDASLQHPIYQKLRYGKPNNLHMDSLNGGSIK